MCLPESFSGVPHGLRGAQGLGRSSVATVRCALGCMFQDTVSAFCLRILSGSRLMRRRLPPIAAAVKQEGDRLVIGWAGKDDPDNPKSWPFIQKIFLTFLVCMLVTAYSVHSSAEPSRRFQRSCLST